MNVSEKNVINAAKAWKRAETKSKRLHWEKMLRLAVEYLERQEAMGKKPARKLSVVKPKPKLKLVK